MPEVTQLRVPEPGGSHLGLSGPLPLSLCYVKR